MKVFDALPSREKAPVPVVPEKVLAPPESSKGATATVIDDDLSEIEDVPLDFDLILPKMPTFGFPNEIGFDENSLPDSDCLDLYPDRPGQEKEMGFEMP